MRRPGMLALTFLLASLSAGLWLALWPGVFFEPIGVLDAPSREPVAVPARATGAHAIVHLGPEHPQVGHRGDVDPSAGLVVTVAGEPVTLNRNTKVVFGDGSERRRLAGTFHAKAGDTITAAAPGVDPPATFVIARSNAMPGILAIVGSSLAAIATLLCAIFTAVFWLKK